tara:strand:+ start:375461 stop:376804 length:1344 start_codon:yes stop_codon:yes gene_type:complete
VLLIGRHFWPHGSIDAAAYLMQLATDLCRRDIHTEVLTPQYASSWAPRFDFRELTVHRPASAPRFDSAIGRDWSVNRYVRILASWIREHGRSYDVMMIDRAQEEVIAAVEAAKSVGCATVVRIGGWEQDNDIRWWQTHRSAGRCMAFTRRADIVVAKSPQDHRALVANAFEHERVVRIQDGFTAGSTRAERDKQRYRRALAAINGDLAAPADMPVALCCTPLRGDTGIRMLTESIRVLVSRYPRLRFWLIGDGPDRGSIYDFLRGEGVRDAIAMPGSFAEMKDLFIAADLFVQLGGTGLDSHLRQAVNESLPIVSVDNESTRAVLSADAPASGRVGGNVNVSSEHEHKTDSDLVAWFEPDRIKSLRLAMRRVLDQPQESADRAAELRRVLCRQRPHHDTVDAYVQLIRRLAGRRANKTDAQQSKTERSNSQQSDTQHTDAPSIESAS